MGICSLNSEDKQVMLVGPQGSGKTRMLYSLKLPNDNWDPDPTYGNYQY